MKRSLSLVVVMVLVSCGFVIGCGESNCPPDFPVARDGFCYRADGGGMAPTDGGMALMDGSMGTVDGGGMPGDDGGGGILDGAAPDGTTGVICVGAHPTVEGTRRFCDPGDCYCGDPENCYPSAIASSCCPMAVVCGDTDGGVVAIDAGPPPMTDGGGGAICVGSHPLVDGTRRYCAPGDCYCGDPENCFPSAIAATCCPVAVVCE